MTQELNQVVNVNANEESMGALEVLEARLKEQAALLKEERARIKALKAASKKPKEVLRRSGFVAYVDKECETEPLFESLNHYATERNCIEALKANQAQEFYIAYSGQGDNEKFIMFSHLYMSDGIVVIE